MSVTTTTSINHTHHTYLGGGTHILIRNIRRPTQEIKDGLGDLGRKRIRRVNQSRVENSNGSHSRVHGYGIGLCSTTALSRDRESGRVYVAVLSTSSPGGSGGGGGLHNPIDGSFMLSGIGICRLGDAIRVIFSAGRTVGENEDAVRSYLAEKVFENPPVVTASRLPPHEHGELQPSGGIARCVDDVAGKRWICRPGLYTYQI